MSKPLIQDKMFIRKVISCQLCFDHHITKSFCSNPTKLVQLEAFLVLDEIIETILVHHLANEQEGPGGPRPLTLVDWW